MIIKFKRTKPRIYKVAAVATAAGLLTAVYSWSSTDTKTAERLSPSTALPTTFLSPPLDNRQQPVAFKTTAPEPAGVSLTREQALYASMQNAMSLFERAKFAQTCLTYREEGAKQSAWLTQMRMIDDDATNTIDFETRQQQTEQFMAGVCATIPEEEKRNAAKNIKLASQQGDVEARIYVATEDIDAWRRPTAAEGFENRPGSDEDKKLRAEQERLSAEAEALIDAGRPEGLSLLAQLELPTDNHEDDYFLRTTAAGILAGSTDKATFDEAMSEVKGELEPAEYEAVVKHTAELRARLSKNRPAIF